MDWGVGARSISLISQAYIPVYNNFRVSDSVL